MRQKVDIFFAGRLDLVGQFDGVLGLVQLRRSDFLSGCLLDFRAVQRFDVSDRDRLPALRVLLLIRKAARIFGEIELPPTAVLQNGLRLLLTLVHTDSLLRVFDSFFVAASVDRFLAPFDYGLDFLLELGEPRVGHILFPAGVHLDGGRLVRRRIQRLVLRVDAGFTRPAQLELLELELHLRTDQFLQTHFVAQRLVGG